MLALALMLDALGYCMTLEMVWPPPGSWLPTQPEITIRTDADLSRAHLTDGTRRVSLERRELAHSVVLTPTEPLTAGTWTLSGAGEALAVGRKEPLRPSWTVREVRPPAPKWAGEPTVETAWAIPPFCGEMTIIELDVPLAGPHRQPLVEVTWTSPARPGATDVGRFPLSDDKTHLSFGCDVLGIDEQVVGQPITLSLVGIDSLGQRSEPRVVTATLTEPNWGP
jgi:hypothetical protein